MARFFIDRPVFAWVISILIMGIGVLSILTLPIAQYPQIAPPSVRISAPSMRFLALTIPDGWMVAGTASFGRVPCGKIVLANPRRAARRVIIEAKKAPKNSPSLTTE